MLFRGLLIASNLKIYFGKQLLSEGQVGETVTQAELYGSVTFHISKKTLEWLNSHNLFVKVKENTLLWRNR